MKPGSSATTSANERVPVADARRLGRALARILAVVGAGVVAHGGCCAWPFEEVSSSATSSEVVPLPIEVAKAGPPLDRPLPAGLCRTLCRQDACFATIVEGRSGTQTMAAVCNAYSPPNCTDSGFLSFRLPSGRRSAALGGMPGQAFSALARAEKASIGDFARLAQALRDHRAPMALVRRVERAERDERRHTATMSELALAYGGSAVCPQARPRCGVPGGAPTAPKPKPTRSLAEIAVENVVAGCVGETWGALLLLHGAERADAAPVRRAFTRVARDEIRHAALAFAVHAWALPRLAASEREAVHTAMQRALLRLRRGDETAKPLVRRSLGLPDREEGRALGTEVERLVSGLLA